MLFEDSSDLPLPYVAGPDAVADATMLLVDFGDDAGDEAATRANRSRDLGNVAGFCRWRQIERLVALLASEDVVGTVH